MSEIRGYEDSEFEIFIFSLQKLLLLEIKNLISADFRHFLVEISEVLPVEISAEKSRLSSTFTGKSNETFGPIYIDCSRKSIHDPSYRFWKLDL